MEVKKLVLSGECQVEFYFAVGKRRGRLIVGVMDEGHSRVNWVTGSGAEGDAEHIEEAGIAVLDEIVEVCAPRSVPKLPKGGHIDLAIRILKLPVGEQPEMELARYPRQGYFRLIVPSQDFLSRNWSAI